MKSRVSRWLSAACAGVLAVGAMVALDPAAPPAAAATGTLSLYKAIDNLGTGASEGDRGKWDVQAVNVDTGETIRTNGLNGFQTRIIPTGTYVISELPNERTPPGYRFRNWNCNGVVYTDPQPVITLGEGQNLTCTVTNEAVQPTLTLRKVVAGGTAPASLWNLRAMDGPTFVGGPANSPAVTNQPVRFGTYRLTEEGPGPAQGYEPSAWECTATNHLGVTTPLAVDPQGRITIELDQAVTCTITNTSASPMLTLVKEVVAPDERPVHPPSSWTLSATPPTGPGISGPSGSPEVSHVGVEQGVDYALAESGPPGYAGSGWSCAAASGTFVFSGTSVNLGAGADVTCTITNTFTGGWLTLEKEVVDSTQPPTTWTLTATGTGGGTAGASVSGPTGSPAVTSVPLPAGDYALAESGPEDYLTDGFSCDGGPAGYAVTVPQGEEVTCTIVNTRPDTLTQLTLVKAVDNTGGGPFGPTQWGVSAIGGTPPMRIAGITGLSLVTYRIVQPGHYTLGEEPLSADPRYADYDFRGWSCADTRTGPLPVTGAGGNEVDIAEGMQVTCTVSNVWTGSLISFTKQIIDTPYSSDEPSAWPLEIQNLDGTPVLSGDGGGGPTGIEQQAIAPGTYRLHEGEGPDGYEGPFYRCIGDADGNPDDEFVTVPESSIVSCTVTNRALPPRVTLRKALDNTGGGTATVADFRLMARGPGDAAMTGTSGDPAVTGVIQPPGEYVFSEDGPPGYDVTWDCVGASAWDPATETATLGAGDDMVCTATNTLIRPTLTLVKSVVGGGPAGETDWTLTADGPGDPISGVTGDPSVTSVPVDVGVYELSEAPSPTAGGRTEGYAAGAWSCTEGTLSGAQLSLAAGQNAVCTVSNSWAGGTLTLVKEVDDGQLVPGGGGAPEDWTLHAVGPVTVEGPGGSAQLVQQPVPAGAYDLSETVTAGPVDPDYRPGRWVCDGTGFTLDDGEPGTGTVTISQGGDVTCTLVNLYRPPHLTLVKQVTGGGPLGDTDAWTLSFAGATSGTGVTGQEAITGVAVGSGEYALAEAPSDPSLAAGYDTGAWTCTGGTVDDHGDGTADLVLSADDLDVICTIENVWTGSTLTLAKVVDDGGETPTDPGTPGDWTLSAAGPTPLQGITGTPDVTSRFVLPGEYELSEQLTGSADAEYLPADWTCTTGAGSSLSPGPLRSGTATLSIEPRAGEDIACTIVNQFLPPHLTLVKEVVGGGPLAEVGDWTLSVTGGNQGVDISAAADDPSLVDRAVGEGVFALAESTTDPDASAVGYTTSGWSCEGGGSLDPGPPGSGIADLTLAAATDADVTCTITNTWTGSHVRLIKAVDDGSTPPDPANVPTDWTLSAVGDDGELHVAGQGGGFLAPGEYALTEAATPGSTIDPDYRPGQWTCTTPPGVGLVVGAPGTATLTLDPGANADVVCTLENVFLPPHLTLVKEVVGAGPRADAADWPLSFDNPASGRTGTGATGEAAVTDAAVGSGTVTLSETPDAQYEGGQWRCTGAANEPSETVDGVATIELTGDDRDVTCTITNTWTGAQLTLVKEVEDGGLEPGTPGEPADWTLSAVGADDELHLPGGGSAFVSAGDYELSETPNTPVDPDYRPGEWTCSPGDGLTPGAPGTGTLRLEPGTAVTCTLTNLFRPPHLTLEKVVDGGPLASTDDWTLEFVRSDGAVSGSGRTGDPTVSGVAVGSGTYTLREVPTDPAAPTEGYATTGWSCDGANPAAQGPDGTATIALDPDDTSVTCVIRNTWTGGTLTLVKVVDGGTAAPGDWTLSARGPTDLSGTTGEPAVTNAPVRTGSYALSETPNAPGAPLNQYASRGWSCTGGELTEGAVTVAEGASVTCTVTNAFDPPRLTLVKYVNGGPAAATSWTLAADGPSAIAGTSGDPLVTGAQLVPGAYTLSETPRAGEPTAGYVTEGWVCEGAPLSGAVVTLRVGDVATCTVSNRHESVPPVAGRGPGAIASTGVDARGWFFGGVLALLIGAGLVATRRALRARE